MKTVKVREIEIGAGIPKICAPIVAKDQTGIFRAAGEIRNSSADLAEWRADWYEDIFDSQKTAKVLYRLRELLGTMPLIFTFRTLKEGGHKDISAEDYTALIQEAIRSGYIDIADVEVSAGEYAVRVMIGDAHRRGVKVLVSSHDFDATPEKKEIVSLLCRMQSLGADILKIAVMPQNKKDVLTLLTATEEMVSDFADCPVISMSMGRVGFISRLCGEVFGSAVTFGSVGEASAPGQMAVAKLRTMIEQLHRNL